MHTNKKLRVVLLLPT